MKLGEVLIADKLITQAQLDDALKFQGENPGKKLGEIVLEKGFINADQLAQVLKQIQ